MTTTARRHPLIPPLFSTRLRRLIGRRSYRGGVSQFQLLPLLVLFFFTFWPNTNEPVYSVRTPRRATQAAVASVASPAASVWSFLPEARGASSVG